MQKNKLNKLATKKIIKYSDVKILKKNLIPHATLSNNYSSQAVESRQSWIKTITNKNLQYLFSKNTDMNGYKKNIENPVGFCEIPVALVGPVLINGDYAKGNFYVPFATTQGTLISSYQRGVLLLAKAGGVKVKVIKDQIDLDPIFCFTDMEPAFDFYAQIKSGVHFNQFKNIIKQTSQHTHLLSITPYLIGKKVLLQFTYNTEDAMGLNMINITTYNICNYLKEMIGSCFFYLRSNLTSDKKSSHFNIQNSYGKEVQAEIRISERYLRKYFRTTPKKMKDLWDSCFMGSYQGGVLGHNAHVGNGVAAIFLATGQDIAQIPNVSTALTYYENENDCLYVSLKIFSLPVATVGGGTMLPTQKEALEIIDCYGPGKAKKFAEIICAAALAGELSIMGAIAQDEHAISDMKLKDR